MQQTLAGQGRTGRRGNQNLRDLSQDLEIPSAGAFFQLFVHPRCGHCPSHGGGRGSGMVTVGTSPCRVALPSCGSESRVTIPRATSGGVD